MAAEIDLRRIRSHEGSQARAWEELAYQLRPPPRDGHIETRKTRAPDAGVEWYEVYSDGHIEGFQAKFHASLQDALGGMRESVVAVCAKRPQLTKLIFVLPYDFTDSGEGGATTDQDRWESAVDRWKADIPGASRIDFATIRAGELVARLALDQHAGRRAYWFGGLELTDDWLRHRFNESKVVADKRYTPEADSESVVNAVLDAVSVGPTFLAEVQAVVTRAISACRQDTGMWGARSTSAESLIADLDDVLGDALGHTVDDEEVLPLPTPDLARMESIATELLGLAYPELDRLDRFDRRNLSAAVSAVEALRSFATGQAARAVTQRSLALVGPAGQGKTHALMRAVEGCLDRGVPAIAVLGQRLTDRNWWPAVAEALDGMTVTSGEFLQALDSMAEARGCRALVVVDALNESQAPKRWRAELPAMLAQFEEFRNLALVVSYRADYRDVVGAPDTLLKVHHPGFAGSEREALGAYCELFDIPVPSKALFDPALTSPLFLRMYCEVIASDPQGGSDAPTRSRLFERYASVIGGKVTDKLDLAPSSSMVSEALERIADEMLQNEGRPVPREAVEADVDALLPGRSWPNTLFQQLASEGLIELQPTFDGTEAVGFPFQAYSEHLLARRLLESVDSEPTSWIERVLPVVRKRRRMRRLAASIGDAPWSWRSLAVLLPESEQHELVDVLPASVDDFRLEEAVRESLVDRSKAAFGPRALELLRQGLTGPTDNGRGVETALALAPREGHPGNADWLHEHLAKLEMADRDSVWSIATFDVDEHSSGYLRLEKWAERLSGGSDEEELRLASIAFMWLLTSPNRFLRDRSSKTLITLLGRHLSVAASLVASAQRVNDPYVQERVLTCTYGSLLIGGDADLVGARSLLEAVSVWNRDGLPVDVIARDSARGIAAWCADRGLLDHAVLSDFEPPYGAEPPDEPPTREALESPHGPLKDGEGNYAEWRASSILRSCLDWLGDFNRYVVKGDVNFFSWHPLAGPRPTSKNRDDPLDEVDADWAGRWIANRAISFGWTDKRFGDFERSHDLRRGRDAHKAERFGKKYQWIAHRELLARLADNFHPAHEPWRSGQNDYQGPWVWYGRDFDPTLPPSILVEESQVCPVALDSTARWAALPAPDLDISATPDAWVAMVDDLPDSSSVFACVDPEGHRWIALQRYSTWDRDNVQRTGMSKRERDIFFLQFSWLVARGQGPDLYAYVEREGLSGRWMPERSRPHHQYLGETSASPIVAAEESEVGGFGLPDELVEGGISPKPAVEHYLWEGNTLDCSVDESVDLYAPTPELLGSARWVGRRAEWAVNGQTVARAIQVPDGRNTQDVLVVSEDWLRSRLEELDMDLLIGTLSERHALPLDDDDYQRMAFSDVWYIALLTAGFNDKEVGPILRVRRRAEEP